MITYVYALMNQYNDIRYIGISIDPNKRLKGHLRDASRKPGKRSDLRIRPLLSKGKVPQIKILETSSSKEARNRERFWIEKGKSLGWKLENRNSGGNRYYGRKMPDSVREKIRQALQGRKRPISVCQKISKSHKKRFKDNPHLRQERSQRMKGRKLSEKAYKITVDALIRRNKQRKGKPMELNHKRNLTRALRRKDVRERLSQATKKRWALMTDIERKEIRKRMSKGKRLGWKRKKAKNESSYHSL